MYVTVCSLTLLLYSAECIRRLSVKWSRPAKQGTRLPRRVNSKSICTGLCSCYDAKLQGAEDGAIS